MLRYNELLETEDINRKRINNRKTSVHPSIHPPIQPAIVYTPVCMQWHYAPMCACVFLLSHLVFKHWSVASIDWYTEEVVPSGAMAFSK